jgi:hypothetical protein
MSQPKLGGLGVAPKGPNALRATKPDAIRRPLSVMQLMQTIKSALVVLSVSFGAVLMRSACAAQVSVLFYVVATSGFSP